MICLILGTFGRFLRLYIQAYERRRIHEANECYVMEAWSIPRNKRVEWRVSWETLYGSLPTGHYRIGKEITDFRAGGDYDKYNCYAEFTVE